MQYVFFRTGGGDADGDVAAILRRLELVDGNMVAVIGDFVGIQ